MSRPSGTPMAAALSLTHLVERNAIDIEFAGSVDGVDAAGCAKARAHHDRLGGRPPPK